MFRLIGLVVSIGLADSMNPSTIAPGLYLAAGTRPLRNLIQFTLGVFAVSFVGGAVLVYGPGQLLLSFVPHPRHTVRYILELAAGVVMLIGAVLLWTSRRRLARHELPEPHGEGKSSAVLGATITAVEFPTAFPYFAAIAAIVGSGLGPERQLVLVILYDICFIVPLLLMILTLAVAGDQAERLLGTAREVLQRYWPAVLAVAALLAGVFVTLLGATGLASHGHSTVARFSRGFRSFLRH